MNVDIDTVGRNLGETVGLDGGRRGKKIRPPSGKAGSKGGSRQSSSERLREANVESFGDKPTPKKETP
jgi:hypothetical protein